MAYERLNLGTGDLLDTEVFKKIDDGIENATTLRTINGRDIHGVGGIEIKNGEAVFYTPVMKYKKYLLSNEMWEHIADKYLDVSTSTGSSRWIEREGYNSYQFTVTDKTMSSLYLTFSSNLAAYYQICRTRNDITERWRTSDNNLPEGEDLAIDIQIGDVISLSIFNSVDVEKTSVYIYQENKIIEADKTYVEHSLSESMFEYIADKYWSSSGWSNMEGYHSYRMIATDDMEKLYLSFSNSSAKPQNYYQICINRKDTFTRYRTTDKNLPTGISNAIEIEPDDIITISSTDAEDVRITTMHIYQTPINIQNTASDNIVSCKCKYNPSMSVTGGIEGLDIYIPQHTGYANWKFVHSVVASKNCDTWRIANCIKTDNEFKNVQQLTTDGAEWEMALKLYERPDFIGGFAHGDEIYTSMMVFIDGRYTNVTSITNLTNFNELRIIVNSTGYDPNDSTTEALYHSKELIWSKEGLTINQRVEWINSYDLSSCYLAMMPPLKHDPNDNTIIITDTYYTTTNYAPTTTPVEGGFSISDRNVIPNRACVFGMSSGVSCTMSVPKYITNYGKNHYYFLLSDNGGNNYNKMYFSIAQNGASVDAGTVWETTTVYNIQC